MSASPFALLLAQAANAARVPPRPPMRPPPSPPVWTNFIIFGLLLAMVYFGLMRPHALQKKKQEETIKGARTGDKVVTSSGIHGVITNVKDSTVIMRVADNVKIELEKTHIDKIIRPESSDAKTDKAAEKAAAKA